ncbi:hypothetical protein [Pseudanabaena sp. PCC 6802]|uniref:hypothetical protein n=1 Tax=Pseudanabaena sp. PCC 6802 TaxID=118173 RepID=UPI000345C323|nr:hypothetical protein [Pseudanabaena sp. PCC 6802]
MIEIKSDRLSLAYRMLILDTHLSLFRNLCHEITHFSSDLYGFVNLCDRFQARSTNCLAEL